MTPPADHLTTPPPPGGQPAPQERSAPARKTARFSAVGIIDPSELEEHLPAWDDLAAKAVEPNVFYESWMLLPAMRTLGEGRRLTAVLVFGHDVPQARGVPLLCGLFPLEHPRTYHGIPVRSSRLWRHVHCYLTTPLIRAGFGREVLAAFFDWLATDRRGGGLLECEWIAADGPFYHLLLGHLAESRRASLVTDGFARAVLRQGGGVRPPAEILSGQRRKKLRRAEERLAEFGAVRYAELAEGGDLDAWLADFLRLESSGWKGRGGTALACSEADRRFFLEVTGEAFRRRRLMMLALYVGERPAALLCNFLAGDGSVAFKVAFDDAYARCSPGVLLELENIRQLHARPEVRWMDSCAGAGNALIEDLWSDRRVIQTMLIETGRAPGALVLAALPLVRWLKRKLGVGLRWIRGRKIASDGVSR
jgi:CelD/BcsL family acetyltransferase involved in cellulose biosynthesis